jgi:hypothetical protein
LVDVKWSDFSCKEIIVVALKREGKRASVDVGSKKLMEVV